MVMYDTPGILLRGQKLENCLLQTLKSPAHCRALHAPVHAPYGPGANRAPQIMQRPIPERTAGARRVLPSSGSRRDVVFLLTARYLRISIFSVIT